MSVIEQLPEDLKALPEHFSPEAREFFAGVMASGWFNGDRQQLIRCCEVGDELAKVRKILASSSHIVLDDQGRPRNHPLAVLRVALMNEYGKLFRDVFSVGQPWPCR